MTRGWIHPDLGLGFEVVGSSPMGDTADAVRARLVHPIPDTPEFRILSVEDMIADRMGQYASGTARDMLAQARELFSLHANVDRVYLGQRIRTETVGDYGIEDLEG